MRPTRRPTTVLCHDYSAMTHSISDYQQKKNFFDRMLTIYGRKPVLEALQDNTLDIYKVHLADSNKPAGIVKQIADLAAQRDIEVHYHERKALSRISRNAKQDQGVAADIHVKQHQTLQQFLQNLSETHQSYPNNAVNCTSVERQQTGQYQTARPLPRLLALCGVHNPQNLGMIIRSACAGTIDGIVIPQKGCASLSSPLVTKASAGTLFKAPIISCEKLGEALRMLKDMDFCVCALSSHATDSLFGYIPKQPTVYVLGNETEGVSADIFSLADKKLMIPMSNNVESLNVAVTAALIAFSNNLE